MSEYVPRGNQRNHADDSARADSSLVTCFDTRNPTKYSSYVPGHVAHVNWLKPNKPTAVGSVVPQTVDMPALQYNDAVNMVAPRNSAYHMLRQETRATVSLIISSHNSQRCDMTCAVHQRETLTNRRRRSEDNFFWLFVTLLPPC